MSRHGQAQPSKGPSQRQLRVGEEVRHALSLTFERGSLRDTVLAGAPVTITEVSVSPDLKNAICFVTPLGGGDADEVQEVIDALQRSAKFLRGELSRKIEMKHTPKLRFMHDASFDKGTYMDSLLQRPEVARDLDVEENDDEEDA